MPWLRLAHAVVAGLVTAFLDLAGVGGFRGGFLIVAAVLVVAYAAPLLAPGRRRSSRRWASAVAVLAIVAAGLLVDRAPYSAPRLAQEMNALPIGENRVLDESHSGNGRCRPSCPAVTRTYALPLLTKRAVVVQIATALQQLNFELDLAQTYREASGFEARKEGVVARVSASTASETNREVVITFVSS